MYTPAQDRSFFEAGIPELRDYLLSEQLYWKLSSSASLPMLTVGGLLLARKRLESAGPRDLEALDAEMHRLHAGWPAAWERKIRHELRARTGLWHTFLADYRHSPEEHAGEYPRQVSWRVMIHLLLQELEALPPEAEALTELDRILRFSFIPGGFVWDASLQPLFPRDPYWFLHGNLKPV